MKKYTYHQLKTVGFKENDITLIFEVYEIFDKSDLNYEQFLEEYFLKDDKNGHKVRMYFILMEKMAKQLIELDKKIKNPEKEGYKEMCDIILKEYKETHDNKEPSAFIYINNADMINLCLLGIKSKQAKSFLEVSQTSSLRDNLKVEYNQAMYDLQMLNGNLLVSHVDFQTRKMIVDNTCKMRYSDLRLRISSEFHEEIRKIKEEK